MITEEQRKAFADLIKEAEKRFENEFDGYLNSLKHELTPKLEARSKARALFDMVRNLRGKLSEATNALRKMGFHVEDGIISIDYDTGDDVRGQIDEVKRGAQEERQKVKAKFRSALFSVLSAQSVDEARKVVEAVL
jgi:hypothetical protein